MTPLFLSNKSSCHSQKKEESLSNQIRVQIEQPEAEITAIHQGSLIDSYEGALLIYLECREREAERLF